MFVVFVSVILVFDSVLNEIRRPQNNFVPAVFVVVLLLLLQTQKFVKKERKEGRKEGKKE